MCTITLGSKTYCYAETVLIKEIDGQVPKTNKEPQGNGRVYHKEGNAKSILNNLALLEYLVEQPATQCDESKIDINQS